MRFAKDQTLRVACEKCGKRFSSYKELREHMREEHSY
jgi:hypothetical protein